MDFTRFTHLTFDCYGTLIDWETGLLNVLMPIGERHDLAADAEQLLRLYAQYEAELEAGEYRPYREVLAGVTTRIATALGFTPSPEDLAALSNSVGQWPPFPDTV